MTSGFDKEKWRAELGPVLGHVSGYRSLEQTEQLEDALALLERAYAEGRAEENEAIAKEFDGQMMVIESKFNGARHECDMAAAAQFVRALAAARKEGGE